MDGNRLSSPVTTVNLSEMDLRRLTKIVECPVCLTVPKNGIMYMCQNGHNVCLPCWKRIDSCPIARCAFDEPLPRQNLTVLALVEEVDFDFPCEFADNGCEVTDKRSLMAEHEEECPYRLIPCPDGNCTKLVKEKELEHHLQTEHANVRWTETEGKSNFLFKLNTSVDVEREHWEVFALQCQGQTFYCQLQRDRGYFYFWTILHGNQAMAERFSSHVQILSQEGEFTTVENLFPLDMPREEIWDDPECLQINQRLIQRMAFERNGERVVNIKMTISEHLKDVSLSH